MTYGDIEERVRVLMNDATAPYRFVAREVYRCVLDAVWHLRSVRPETRYVDGVLAAYEPVLDKIDEDTEIPLPMRWGEALARYAAYDLYLANNPDTEDASLAGSHLQRAEALMQI